MSSVITSGHQSCCNTSYCSFLSSFRWSMLCLLFVDLRLLKTLFASTTLLFFFGFIMRLIKFNGTKKTICFSHYYTGCKNSCRHWHINLSIKLSRTCLSGQWRHWTNSLTSIHVMNVFVKRMTCSFLSFRRKWWTRSPKSEKTVLKFEWHSHLNIKHECLMCIMFVI